MNLLFDLDGTLMDSRPGILACIRYALEQAGTVPPNDKELQRCIGAPLNLSFAQWLAVEVDAPCVAKAVAAYRERFTARGMFENAVFDQIPATLDQVASCGGRLYVATSKPRIYAERILEHFELADRFIAVFGSELDGSLCDKSDLLQHAIRSAGLDPAATVMIGDREYDMLGAVRNHVYPAGVLWGYGSDEELRRAGAKRLLSAPAEIPELLTRAV